MKVTYYNQGKLDIRRTIANRVALYVKQSNVPLRVASKEVLLEIAGLLRN